MRKERHLGGRGQPHGAKAGLGDDDDPPETMPADVAVSDLRVAVDEPVDAVRVPLGQAGK
jgi:hypothetical protein